MKFREFGLKILTLSDKILDYIPVKSRKIIIFGFAGLVFLILLLTISAIVTGRKPEPVRIASGIITVPADELFYPGEPDFLPALLLEREPRGAWTIEDIEPFWNNPRQGHEEEWKEVVRLAIDRLLENVP